MLRKTEERKLQVRFLKIMTDILFAASDKDSSKIWRSFQSIDWESVPMASVRMGFNDFVEMTQGISGKDLSVIDSLLEKHGAYTLSQARDKGYCRVMQLLTFSKIKRESDAYLLKGMIDSTDSRFSEDQLIKMEELLETYHKS